VPSPPALNSDRWLPSSIWRWKVGAEAEQTILMESAVQKLIRARQEDELTYGRSEKNNSLHSSEKRR
jgi:hypothetical protein